MVSLVGLWANVGGRGGSMHVPQERKVNISHPESKKSNHTGNIPVLETGGTCSLF